MPRCCHEFKEFGYASVAQFWSEAAAIAEIGMSLGLIVAGLPRRSFGVVRAAGSKTKSLPRLRHDLELYAGGRRRLTSQCSRGLGALPSSIVLMLSLLRRVWLGFGLSGRTPDF